MYRTYTREQIVELGATDVTDVGDVQPYHGDAYYGVTCCQLCGQGPTSTGFAFHFAINGGATDYTDWACRTCTRRLLERDPFWCSRDNWLECVRQGKNTYRVYRECEIIDDLHV